MFDKLDLLSIMILSSTTKGDTKMQDKIFKAAQRIIDNPWFLGCFMAFVFAYLIYRGF